MATLDELNSQLAKAAALLDSAAATIRDAQFHPTSEHIGRVGQALAAVFAVQHAIYELRPDLMPPFLRGKSESSEANRRLTVAMGESDRLASKGQTTQAAQVLKEYLAAETSSHHRSIAQLLLSRYTAGNAT